MPPGYAHGVVLTLMHDVFNDSKLKERWSSMQAPPLTTRQA